MESTKKLNDTGQRTIDDASGVARGRSTEDNRYTSTSQAWNETLALCHLRSRMYDQINSPFCSRDPVGYVGSRWGLYEYVGSMPANAVDPGGLEFGPVTFPWGGPKNLPSPPRSNHHGQAREDLKNRLLGMCIGCDTCNYDDTGCDPSGCQADAINIADSIYNTLENNDPWYIPRPIDSRYQGYYCYDWAYAFEQAVENSSSGCFSASVQSSQKRLFFVHYWIEISSPCSDTSTFVDDGFGRFPRGTIFVHGTAPDCSDIGYTPADANPGDPRDPSDPAVIPYGPDGNPIPGGN